MDSNNYSYLECLYVHKLFLYLEKLKATSFMVASIIAGQEVVR